jgi:hypothetical protein
MKLPRIVFITIFTIAASPFLHGQGQRGLQAPTPPATAKAGAPIDLTGNWVAIVTEDWRWRMVTPPKGDYASIPMTAAAKKIADAWDPARDEAAGEQCRSFGAAAIMRVPGRLRISWQDDSTLKVETDAGTQTRMFHFGSWKGAEETPTWQGDSIASWDLPSAAGQRGSREAPKVGNLKVVTTHLRPGYLRKNGVPYSANARVMEYWDLHKNRTGEWLVITTLVDDPEYLQQQYVTSSNFKREPDSSKWDPTPCSARW